MTFNTLTINFDSIEEFNETRDRLASRNVSLYEWDEEDLWMEVDVSGFTVDDFKKYLEK